MNIQRQKRTVFGKAVHMHVCVLSRENWPDTEVPKVEVISSVHEGTKFVALGASVCQAPLQQRLPAGIVAIVAAVYTSINIEALIPVGRVRPPAACVHIDIPWVQPPPGMSIGAKEPDGEAMWDPVIKPNRA